MYRANLCLCALPTSLLPATGSADELVNKTSCFCGVRRSVTGSGHWGGSACRHVWVHLRGRPVISFAGLRCGCFCCPLPSVCVLILCVDHYGRRWRWFVSCFLFFFPLLFWGGFFFVKVANPEISVTDSFFVSLGLLECLCALPRLNKLLHTTRNTPDVIYLIKESHFSYAQGKVSVRKMRFWN